MSQSSSLRDATVADYENVAGNHYDKYNTSNPIARWLMNGFLDAFDRLSSQTGAEEAFEAGCGEGHLSLRLERAGLRVRGVDLEDSAIAEARTNAAAQGSSVRFEAADLYTLDSDHHGGELVVSCEVLEHVPDPDRALDVLTSLAKPWLLLSVPREPIWRAMNMARGKYLPALGNTPGHIQHWSSSGFQELVSRHARIVEIAQPLPWTMLLCRCD